MVNNRLPVIARFCVSFLELSVLCSIVILCHISCGEANTGDADEMYYHGSECTVNYDGYCLHGRTSRYLVDVDANGPACVFPHMYGAMTCDKYMWWT